MTIERERRRRVLTDKDIAEIREAATAAAIEAAKHHTVTCNVGLNPEQAEALRGILKEGLTPEEARFIKRLNQVFDSVASITGRAVLWGVLTIVGAVLVAGFWSSIATGLKKFKG